MGYTHYWRRIPEIDADLFTAATIDIKEVLATLGRMGVKLAGPTGTGAVEINESKIAFNGVQYCGHTKRDLGITWPADGPNVGGVGNETKGKWHAGTLLTERTCGGNCSHESFYFERIFKEGELNKSGLRFNFCKTAYKPYDLAVTAALIICKHHLKDKIQISSDGEDRDWRDAAMICQMTLGYGADFKLPAS